MDILRVVNLVVKGFENGVQKLHQKDLIGFSSCFHSSAESADGVEGADGVDGADVYRL